MKFNKLFVLSCVVVLFISLAKKAKEEVTLNDKIKIGIVDVDQIARTSKYVAKKMEFINKLKAKGDKLTKHFSKVASQMKEIDQTKLNSDVLNKKRAELLKDYQDTYNKIVDIRREYGQRMNNFMKEYEKILSRSIKQVAKDLNLDLVLKKGGMSMVAYFSKDSKFVTDITKKVIEIIDKLNSKKKQKQNKSTK